MLVRSQQGIGLAAALYASNESIYACNRSVNLSVRLVCRSVSQSISPRPCPMLLQVKEVVEADEESEEVGLSEFAKLEAQLSN